MTATQTWADDLSDGLRQAAAEIERLRFQLDRANKIVGWMMPYIGRMCPPSNGLYDLNIHCCENKIPEPGDESKGRPLKAESKP